MGGAASLQTSKGSIFDPFASGVSLQLEHLSSFLYIIYTENFTWGQKRTSLNKGDQPVSEPGYDTIFTVVHSQLLEHSHYSKTTTSFRITKLTLTLSGVLMF